MLYFLSRKHRARSVDLLHPSTDSCAAQQNLLAILVYDFVPFYLQKTLRHGRILRRSTAMSRSVHQAWYAAASTLYPGILKYLDTWFCARISAALTYLNLLCLV